MDALQELKKQVQVELGNDKSELISQLEDDLYVELQKQGRSQVLTVK